MAIVTNADAAVTLTDTTLRGAQGQQGLSSMVSFLRANDANAYGAGDVVSDNAGVARAIAFPNCGRGGLIVGASLVVAETDTADFDLFLFDQEPTNHADNAALALVASDQPKLLGVFRFLTGAKVNVGTNLELYRAVSAGTDQAVMPIGYTTTLGQLFGLLVTRTVYTPIAQCKFTIRLGITRVVG